MPMHKIYSLPSLEQAAMNNTNSINQIVLQVAEQLPEFGWEITNNEHDADLVVAHAGQTFGTFPCDVAHCHGLFPTFHFQDPKWHFKGNELVIQNLRYAKAITVPSQWVGDIIRRELNRDAVIVNWAIDKDQWTEQTHHEGYTLWNKTRIDHVCDPAPIEFLADQLPDQKFMTTFANKPRPNMPIVGLQAFPKMQQTIQNAALYLATTKETFGIGTLEAMACGIPILGYNWGGTADIVEHGLTGYLVEPGDLEGLLQGWHWCMEHRESIAYHARRAALESHYSWERVAAQFAEVYDEVLALKNEPSPYKVSVVIPCYNYAKFLPLAVESVLKQETNFEFEVIIVDDGSDDESYQIAKTYQETSDIHIHVIQQSNAGVAAARNRGIRTAKGRFITCLDADDLLGDLGFLQLLADNLDADPLLGLAYTGLAMFTEDPFQGCTPSKWPIQFNAGLQYSGKNQVPTCNMFRKIAWERAGGYRKNIQPAEDAGLWYLMSILGWSIRKVTEKPMFLYRYHQASLSAKIRRGMAHEPQWTALHEAGTAQRYPMAAQLDPMSYSKFPTHPVRNYDKPLFSFIIPVGKGHEQIVERALDSIWGQTEWRWEAIVVNDTPDALSISQRWAKLINQGGATSKGAGYARNLGIASAEGKYLIFLDADDMLLPNFLHEAYQLHRATGHYIYSDWFIERDGIRTVHNSKNYSQALIFSQTSIHPITALIPAAWVNEVGGFDNQLVAWEDTDLFIKMAIAGFCGKRLPKALIVYNHNSGMRRELGVAQSDNLKRIFRERYGEYLEAKRMAKSCCGDQKPSVRELDINDENTVRVMMVNGPVAPITVKGLATKKVYGRKQRGDIFVMFSKDVAMQPETFAVVDSVDNTIEATPRPSAPPKPNGAKS